MKQLLEDRDARRLDEYTNDVRKTVASYRTIEAVDRELDTFARGLARRYAERIRVAEGRGGVVSSANVKQAQALLLGSGAPGVPKFESQKDQRKYEVLMERKRELGWVDPDAPEETAQRPTGERYVIEGFEFQDPQDYVEQQGAALGLRLEKQAERLRQQIAALEEQLQQVHSRDANKKRKLTAQIKQLQNKLQDLK